MLIAEYSYETDIKVQRREAFKLGKEEGAIETAKKAIKMGLSIQQIMQLTGLSEDSIKQLTAKKEN